MLKNRNTVMRWVGLSEGGLVDHPHDTGGRTNRGITQRVYTAWLRQKRRDNRAVDHITKDEAEAILIEQYFAPVQFDLLPSGLDYSVVDYGINSGTGKAVKDLQRTLNGLGASPPLRADGGLGLLTLEAISDAVDRGDLIELIEAYNRRRWAFMKTIRSWPHFKDGWTTRVMGNKPDPRGTVDDVGVIDRSVAMASGGSLKGSVTASVGRAEEPDEAEATPAALGAITRFLRFIFGGPAA